MQLINKAKGFASDVVKHWNKPAPGKYVPYKGIFGYSFGGIGAYMIITMGTACLLSINNTLLTMVLGVKPTHMYIMYVICVIANIPLTGIRANIIDNTRNKAGKYRPYILTMAIPSALLCILLVSIPYGSFSEMALLQGNIFGETKAYVAKCTIILVINLLLHFFYYFFYDSYENLIHVLSPDSQERANVQSVKSVVYSFAPTVVNFISPLIAKHIFQTNTTDIRVYRLLYPILTVLGILLCIIVYKNTEEKIVQARTHVVQIKFIDALRAVAKNKYFWIISLAGWIGFLESSYSNILAWLYNYGGACNGDEYGFITLVYGNASLWGMLLAPFAIKRWGKKAVLIFTNFFNIVFILMMLPCCQDITKATIWLVMGCLWLNALMGSFAHILNPAIQADIRDYQQYQTGERIDGMFSAVATIGTVITLLTSSVLPMIYEKNGLTEENALRITSDPNILGRILGDGKSVGQILAEQFAEGQDNYSNSFSALYDTNILLSLLQVLIVLAAIGAFMNVIPFFWYDFNEVKQKSVVRVLKVRALFEDYGNNTINDRGLVEGVDIITNSRELCNASPRTLDKKAYKAQSGKEARKAAKKQYFIDKDYNNEIEIAKFVCNELDRFSSATGKFELSQANAVYSSGINSILHTTKDEVKAELAAAKAMTKNSPDEKEMRKIAIENAKKKLTAVNAVRKSFKGVTELIQPDFSELDKMYDREDEINALMKSLYLELDSMKKSGDKTKKAAIQQNIASLKSEKQKLQKDIKTEMNRHAYFNRAAKPYVDAEKLLKQSENYTHIEDIKKNYESSKARYEEELKQQALEEEKKKAEKAAEKKK